MTALDGLRQQLRASIQQILFFVQNRRFIFFYGWISLRGFLPQPSAQGAGRFQLDLVAGPVALMHDGKKLSHFGEIGAIVNAEGKSILVG